MELECVRAITMRYFIFKIGREVDDGDSFKRTPDVEIVNETRAVKSIRSILFNTDTASYTQYF